MEISTHQKIKIVVVAFDQKKKLWWLHVRVIVGRKVVVVFNQVIQGWD